MLIDPYFSRVDLLRVALGSRIQPNASRINAVEEEHRGMINKYLSDGFMAIFGAGDSGSNHPRDAVSAGCEILRAVKGLNDELAAKERAAIQVGIGIHSGPAIVGSVGSPQRLEFTAQSATR